MKRRNVIAVLVFVAVAGGLAWWLTRPGLASEIAERGGQVIYEPETPEGPTTSIVFVARPIGDADLSCLRGKRGFQRLLLDTTQVTGEGLENLNGSLELRWLSLKNCPIGDAGLKHLPELPNLEFLSLERTRITDAGLAELARLKNLQYLYIGQNKISDACLEHLKGLRKLERLDAIDTGITPEGIRKLQETLPGLTKVITGRNDD